MPLSPNGSSRRDWLKWAGAGVAGAWVSHALPDASAFALPQAVDQLTAMRNQMGATPIEATKLSTWLSMLSGPGGNVVVLYGSDGTVVVDTFVQPAWAGVGKAIKGLTQKPVTTLIDTHWHFDHTDNNAQFRRAGATIVAHANTKKRMSETHELLGITFKPQAIDAVPTEVFADRKMIQTNGETLTLQHVAPAHTDTDVILHFANANVIQTGDVYFADAYPFIDLGTGGNINGMIAAAETVLAMADDKTMLVPGHGPLSTRADLEKSHAMCITVRDRVKKLKSSGRTLQQTVDAKPTADFDAAWGKGFVNPAGFVELVYKSI